MLAAMNHDLHAFVRAALERGLTHEQLRSALRDARWPDDEIEAELSGWHDAGIGLPVPRRRVGLSAREAFFYLLLFVALYMVAFHVGWIGFVFIERAWPDLALVSGYEFEERVRDTVRFSIATLLVAFPVYLYTSRLIGSAMALDPEKRNSSVRRWLTYLTLFVAACVLIGDFIAVLLGFLKGELTPRFVSKAVVVGLIAGFLFSHYMGGLRRDEEDAPASARRPASPWLARVAGLMVVFAIASGMWLAGTPANARLEALDQLRLRHLEALSNAIQTYHDNFLSAPSDLGQLAQLSPGTTLTLSDPIRNEPYGYRTLDSATFELCARFDRPDSVGPHGGAANDFWRHGAGEACFSFRFRAQPRAIPVRR